MLTHVGHDQPPLRVLLVDHDRKFGEAAAFFIGLQRQLELVAWEQDCNSGLRHVIHHRPDVIVLGWSEDARNIVSVVRRLNIAGYTPAIIVFADNGDARAYAAAKHSGAEQVSFRADLSKSLLPTIRSFARRSLQALMPTSLLSAPASRSCC